MPEGPEVQNVVNRLRELVTGKKIKKVTILVDRIIRTPDVETFSWSLQEETIRNVERKGKHIIFVFDKFYIVSHLRMEGKYEFTESNKTLNKHDHVIFHFEDGTELRYNDVRKFGTMDLVRDVNEVKSVAELGLDPLDNEFDADYLSERLKSKKTKIKNLLLNQEIVHSLGNIYVDECCYLAGILPDRVANTLNYEECKKLAHAIKEVITIAIEKGGSTIRSYNSMGEVGSMQNFHKVYGKNGEPCVKCGHVISKMKLNGRGTHFCSKCQK